MKAIRERRGWTQQSVAERLGRITGHQLPQASISAMERGFDGERRRRFDAHELYFLSVVFDVPIAYFFVPPPGTGFEHAGRHRDGRSASCMRRCSDRSRNSRRSTSASRRSRSATPRRATRPRRDLRRRRRVAELARELPDVAQEAPRRDRARVRRPARRSRIVPQGVRDEDRGDWASRATCSRWRTARVRACSIPRWRRCPPRSCIELIETTRPEE